MSPKADVPPDLPPDLPPGLGARLIPGAILRAPSPLRFGHVATGVFDADRRPLAHPPLVTSTDSVFPRSRPPSGPLQTLEGLAIWGGAAFTAFGHWLTETLPFLATLRPLAAQFPEAPILMVLRPGHEPVTWGPLHQVFAKSLGIDLNRIRLLQADTQVDRLILPPDPFGRANHYAPATIPALDALGLAPATGSGERLFLSRRKLSARNSRTPNIAAIEATFAEAGFTILHPEELDLPTQMRRLLAARVLAGENGSALHWSLWSPHVRAVISLGWDLKLQRGICAAREQAYLPARVPGLWPLMGRRQRVPLAVVRRAIRAAG